MSVLAKLPPIIERHELKYAIPYSYVESISKFIDPYCSLDHHSAIEPDHFYRVNSLYFDTRSLEFLQQRMYGKDGRFNFRVRCYGDEGKPPYFLEIKRKSGTTGKKYRAVAGADEWPRILTDPSFRISESDSQDEIANKSLFLRLATSYAVEPKVLTQYRRRAFFSVVDDYARVTMDASMKYRVQHSYSLVPDSTMVSYDNETIYDKSQASEAAVILELKCNIGQVPIWMLDLISTFNLQQQGFSKYLNSSLVGYVDDGIDYMSGDRIACGYINGDSQW
jgi:SPX domain protein involved in polyphosphate accumulation